MKRYTLAFIIALTVMLAGIVCAADKTSGRSEVLSIIPMARQMAVGGAVVTMGDDPTATMYNPAGLGQISGYHGGVNYSFLYQQSLANYLYLGYAMEAAKSLGSRRSPMKSLGIGINFMQLSTSGIPLTSSSNFDYGADGFPNTGDPGENDGDFSNDGISPEVTKTGTTSYSENALVVGAGQEFEFRSRLKMYLGLNLKFLFSGFSGIDVSGSGFSFDIGGQADLAGVIGMPREQKFILGLVLDNVYGSSKYKGTVKNINGKDYSPEAKNRIPIAPRFGAQYTWATRARRGMPPEHEVNILSQFSYDDDIADFSIGSEYWYNKMLAGRVGIYEISKQGDSMKAKMNLGFGVRIDNTYQIDYSLSFHGGLGASHRVSGLVRFNTMPASSQSRNNVRGGMNEQRYDARDDNRYESRSTDDRRSDEESSDNRARYNDRSWDDDENADSRSRGNDRYDDRRSSDRDRYDDRSGRGSSRDDDRYDDRGRSSRDDRSSGRGSSRDDDRYNDRGRSSRDDRSSGRGSSRDRDTDW